MKVKSKFKNIERPNKAITQFRKPEKLWLDKNENSDEVLFKKTKKILNSLDKRAIFSYPDLAPLYIKLSKSLKINTKNILLTAGSDAGIKTVFETFINKGDIVFRTNPTFAMYSVYSKVFNVKEILLEYKKTNFGPKIKMDQIITKILLKKPKLICLPNPDSPTGHAFTLREIEKLLIKAKSVNSLVLIDEAYYPFYACTVKSLIQKYKNLIITRTTAKAWGLAGLRVGYVMASENIIKEMQKTRPMYEINNIGAEVFYKLLDKSKFINTSVARLLSGKQYFKKELIKLGFNLFNKEEGNFIHVNFKKDRKRIVNELKKKIYFRHLEKHKSMKNFSRFTITSKKNFKTIILIIKKCTKKN